MIYRSAVLVALVAGTLPGGGAGPVAAPATYAAAATDSVSVERGRALFAQECAICHTPTRNSTIGPDLTFVARRRSYASLRRHLATAVPGHLRPGEVAVLTAYLARLSERKP